MDFEDNDTKYDNYILIDKYDVNGKKLLNSYIRETYSTDDFEEDYFMSDQSIINYNENEIVYYIIISKDIEVGETHDNRVILKLSKVNI